MYSILIKSFSLVLISFFLVQCQQETEKVPTRTDVPNIIIIISDDHGRELGSYGHPLIKTPNIDKLASQGTRFTNAFATTASCSASRSVILTGLYNHRNAQYGHTHDYHHFSSYSDIKSLPVLLGSAGYRTACIGKKHVQPNSVYDFDVDIRGNERNGAKMAETSRKFIEESGNQPFFLYFATSDPHRGGGLMAGGSENNEVLGAINRFGNTDEGYEGIEETVYDTTEITVPAWLPDNATTKLELSQYYQSVSRMDFGVGRLLAVLKETGNYDNSIIIYMSDHGPAFAGAKTTVYEPGLRTPLIVKMPGQTESRVTEAMVHWPDITPTLLEIAGVEEPVYDQHIGAPSIRAKFDFPKNHGLHGRSFLSVLNGADESGFETVYASHTFHEIQMYYPMRVVRDKKYKLIWNIASGIPYPFSTDLWASGTWQRVYHQGPETPYGVRTVQQYIHRDEFELFDIEEDPLESKNLANDPAFAEVLKQYKEKLKEFQVRTSDPWVNKWIYQ